MANKIRFAADESIISAPDVRPERLARFVVQWNMNPLARAVPLGIAGLALPVLFTTAALTNDSAVLLPRPFANGLTNLCLAPLSCVPIVRLDRNPNPSQPLPPGVYKTRPYDIILVAPKRGIDDRMLAGLGGAEPIMPVVKPKLRAIPISPAP